SRRPGEEPDGRQPPPPTGTSCCIGEKHGYSSVGLLWGDLPADLRIPVACYSLLLTAMACRAGVFGLRAGVGGALFLLSDSLIASGVAAWPQLPRPDFWIMATYAAAQYLLTTGALDRGRTGVR
ncbi:lysoplasmalogenase family protein, partial [Streptomyces sp. NPDC004050]